MDGKELPGVDAEFAAIDADRKVCPFDHHTEDYAHGHREMYKALREAGPVVWSDAYGGFWVATDHRHASEVLRDSETFTVEAVDSETEGGTLIPTPKRAPWLSPDNTLFNFIDGPRHDIVRAALNPHFSRRRVSEIDETIKSRVDRVFDQVLPRREFDIVDDLAGPIVAGIVNDHMGFGLENPTSFFHAVSGGK